MSIIQVQTPGLLNSSQGAIDRFADEKDRARATWI